MGSLSQLQAGRAGDRDIILIQEISINILINQVDFNYYIIYNVPGISGILSSINTIGRYHKLIAGRRLSEYLDEGSDSRRGAVGTRGCC